MLTPCITELVNVASPISSAYNLCVSFYPRWIPEDVFHAGKTPLSANYLADGFWQLQVHLSA